MVKSLGDAGVRGEKRAGRGGWLEREETGLSDVKAFNKHNWNETAHVS